MSSSGTRTHDYSGVTETPGDRITIEAARMAVSRYELVRRIAGGLRVLEVACGSGQGLGFVGQRAASVIGGDITFPVVQLARRHYGSRHPVVQFDAHALPFRRESFDVIAMHEAIYYLRAPEQAMAEFRRVLSPGGTLVLTSINPQWKDFNPSPASTRYFSIEQLRDLASPLFSKVEMYGGFAVSQRPAGRFLSLVKQAAVRLNLIPRTMKGKRILKRLFLGRLVTVPAELPADFSTPDEPVSHAGGPLSAYKVVYIIATA